MAVEKILITEDEIKSMTPYKSYIINILLIIKILEAYINFRQYKRLKENRPLPKELVSLGFDKSKHEEFQKYSRAKIKFKIFFDSVKTILSVLFIYFNFYPFQYHISQKLCSFFPLIKFNPENEYGPLVWYIFFELLFEEIVDLPFELYLNFVLEEKFGFNKTTLKTFFKDQIITFILFLIFLPIIVSILVYIIIKTGKYFYYFTEIAGIILVLIFMWVYPNFIQPLFNNFKELDEGELKKGIFELAKRVNYPLTKIYEMDASKRSSHSNAYLFGFWKNKRIVLFDTLLKDMENKEIESCLSHELGHWSKWHSLILLFITFTNFFIIFYLLQFFINETAIFVSFGFEQKSVFIGLYLFFIIYSPFSFFINILQNSIVRRLEYQADKYAYDLGYGDNLIKALAKLSESNKSGLDADPLYSLVNNSHPILIERIRAINKYKDEDKKEK